MDYKQDGYHGISLERAYNELLKNKKKLKKIIVAIIDDGSFDSSNPDLIGMEWTNKKELPGNGIDDDHNGFVDDLHGWSFTGNKLNNETSEAVREYVRLKSRFQGRADTITLLKDAEYTYWKKMRSEKNDFVDQLTRRKSYLETRIKNFQLIQEFGNRKLGRDTIGEGDINSLNPDTDADSTTIKAYAYVSARIKSRLQKKDHTALFTWIKDNQKRLEGVSNDLYTVNMIIENNDAGYFRKRDLHDDPYTNIKKNYGSGDLKPLRQEYSHGMGCAGIICALRNNSIGTNGITNAVMIMPIKQFVGGDEWDKDVANAIIYAVDNGAQVINMSFGKYQSPQKQWVDEAFKYAEKKGVLLISGAGNDAVNTDSVTSYPTAVYNDGKKASNVINVGASGYDSPLVANFSNYGNASVDVFAPGVNITTTSVNNELQTASGTSFSAPIVCGLAAFIWSYYPTLNYKEVKYCIERSATPVNTLVIKPGKGQKVPFRSLSKTGGIVNAYRAILIAEQISKTIKQQGRAIFH
ncbi:S8 family serine peptidase [Mucilaginibacter terrae]|uniref:S8 family serine peptidase n=1 Tax=Mucilaginibacter terrae TaxID=1955052 RepID=UPI00363D2B88